MTMLPYLATAKRLHRQWFYISHLVFGYTTDLLVALTALGSDRQRCPPSWQLNRSAIRLRRRRSLASRLLYPSNFTIPSHFW